MSFDQVTVRWAKAEVVVGTAAASNSRMGFIEDSSLTSEQQAVEYGVTWLAQQGITVDQVDMTVQPTRPELVPWSGVAKGDALRTLNRTDSLETSRVMGTGFTGLRRNGEPNYTFTLGSASQQRFVTSQRQLTQISEGSMRGSFGAATISPAPSFGDLDTGALPKDTLRVADVDQFVAADDPDLDTERPQDRAKPLPFDEAKSIIRFENAAESLVADNPLDDPDDWTYTDSVVDIWRVAYSPDGTEIAAEEIDTYTWPGNVYRFTYVTELLFTKGQALQLRTPAGGAGSHRLITIQPVASSPN